MLSDRQVVALILAGFGIAALAVGVVIGFVRSQVGPLKARIVVQDSKIQILRDELTTHKLAVKVALAVQTRKLLGKEDPTDGYVRAKEAAPDPARAAGDTSPAAD